LRFVEQCFCGDVPSDLYWLCTGVESYAIGLQILTAISCRIEEAKFAAANAFNLLKTQHILTRAVSILPRPLEVTPHSGNRADLGAQGRLANRTPVASLRRKPKLDASGDADSGELGALVELDQLRKSGFRQAVARRVRTIDDFSGQGYCRGSRLP
jgi:hypothetical protein